tara:strand:+ start:80091 stop:80513 length:423 start_codon:yes stop_codon:yes gene_type:complete
VNYLRIAGGVLIILLVAVGWGQYHQIGLQRELIEKQEVAIDTAIQNTEKVLGIVEKNDVLMTDLLMAQGQVNSSLIARQQEIRRLQNDIEEVREWAKQSLPADIIRLRQRPATTGASGYGQSVSPGSAVRASAGESKNER